MPFDHIILGENPLGQHLTLHEHIRRRPAMYLGSVRQKGFAVMLNGMLTATLTRTAADGVTLIFGAKSSIKCRFDGLKNHPDTNWFLTWQIDSDPNAHASLFTATALSTDFTARFITIDNHEAVLLHFQEGVLQTGPIKIPAGDYTALEFDFTLDPTIWGADFAWNDAYLLKHIYEFAYLNKNVRFDVQHTVENVPCRSVFHFKNGLKDRVDLELLHGHTDVLVSGYLEKTFDNFSVEAAFGLRKSDVDPGFLRSYVNYRPTSEHGTHVDALLQGLLRALPRSMRRRGLTGRYRWTLKQLRYYLVGAIHVQMKQPRYSGSVSNCLTNDELIVPITEAVVDFMLQQQENL